MIRRTGRVVVRHCTWLLHYLIVALIGVSFAIVIGLTALTLRLSTGSIDLTWIAALYGNSIQVTRGGVHLSFDRALLGWEGFQHGVGVPLDIRLTQVRVTDAEAHVLASADHAYLAVALGPLMLGRFVPHAIDLEDGDIALIRDREGSPDLRLSSELDADAPEVPRRLAADRRSIRDMLFGSDLLSQLDHVRLRNFRLGLRGGAPATNWHADIRDLLLQRQPGGEIAGSAHVPLTLGDRTADLALHVNLPRNGIGDIGASLGPIEAAAVADIFPALSFLSAVEAPATTDVTLRLDHELAFLGGSATVSLGSGRVSIARASLLIGGGILHIHAVPERVVIDDASLRVWASRQNATTTVSLKGTIDRMGERVSASVTAGLENLDVADLADFWPGDVARGARSWVVENVTAGLVPRATAALVAEGDADLKDVTVTKATADVDATNVTLTWLDQMPPIEHAQVHLHLANPDKLVITMPSGRQRIRGGAELAIRDGEMEITGLSVPDQSARITLGVDGPITSSLALLREPRLKILSKHPIDLQDPSGTASTNVSLAFPLDSKLQAEQVEFHVTSRLEKVRVARLVAGRDLTDGTLDLTADPGGLTLKGQAVLAGISLTADGFFDFNSGPPTQVLQRVNATARPTAAQLAAAGFPVDAYVTSGDVPLTVALTERRNGDGNVAITADLGSAAMQVRPLGWSKPASAPGKASATLVLTHDVLKAVRDITADSRDLAIAANADIVDGSVRTLTLNRARIGRTDTRGTIRLPARGSTEVTLTGGTLDLAPELERPSEPGRPRNTDVPDLIIRARLDRVILARNITANGASIQATTQDSQLRGLDASATLSPGAPFQARITQSGANRRLSVQTADAGSLLQGLALTSSVRGGRLQINGEYDDRLPTRPLSGQAQIDDARLENVPLLGRILQAATLYGVADLLNGPGMGVSRIIVPFRYERTQLSINEARMFSSSLGLTAQGVVDIGAGRMNLTGTVVPAYVLNSALGRIPFVGRIFSAEKGGGLFAVRYTVVGPFGDASISVNPLSVLTPGFLRGLFDGGG